MKPDTNVPLPWGIIKNLIDERIELIQERTKAESWQGYLTGKDNFRYKVATIQPYKEGRGEKPFWYEGIRQYLIENRNVIVVNGYEADDALAINGGSQDAVICSRDKDLRQVPGWHYSWEAGLSKERPMYWISELDGYRNFFVQCLIGDPVDSIPGLYQVGEKAACVQRVEAASTELEMFQEVKTQYQQRFGSYWDMFLCENGRLLWMLRTEDDDWWKRQKEFTKELEC